MKIIQIDITKTPAENCKDIPSLQGIYFIWSKNKLLYIGETDNLNTRLRNHIGNSSYSSVNPKIVQYLSYEEISHCKDAEDDLLNWLSTKNNNNPFRRTKHIITPKDVEDQIMKVEL